MVLFMFLAYCNTFYHFICLCLFMKGLWNSYASSTAWLWNILALLCFSLWLALCSSQSLLSYRQGEATLIMENGKYIIHLLQLPMLLYSSEAILRAQWHLHFVLSLNKDDVAN